jgi:hypothetical protein
MGGTHGVNKPRAGRRSKTPGGRCAPHDHRQRAAGSERQAYLKRGVTRTGLTNPVLGAARRLPAKGALRATTVRERSDGQWAAGNGQRATGSLENRCVSHGVNKPCAGRSKTHSERCASRDHRQTAQRRATSEERPATSAMPMAVFTTIPPPIAMTKCASLNAAQLRRLTVVARSAPFAGSLRTAPSTGFVNPVRDTPLFKGARCPLPVARRPLPAARRPSLAARCCALCRWSREAHLSPGVFERRPARGLLTPCESHLFSLGPLPRR